MLMPLGLLSQGGGAAGGLPAFELISTQTVASATASLTFSSIVSTYTHLQLRVVGRTTRAIGIDQISLQFNADTGANYVYHLLFGTGASVISSNTTSTTGLSFGSFNDSNSGAGQFGIAIADIMDYTSTAKNKTVRAAGGAYGAGYTQAKLSSGAWLSTSAITSIKVFPTNGNNLDIGTRISLYGIKGA